MATDPANVSVAADAETAGKRSAGRPASWWEWETITGARFGLILGLLILASFPKVLAGLETFVVRDFGFFAYPAAHFQRQSFWNGELPLWNPYNNCGVPFLAQWNTMALYPPSLIYLLAPLSWSLSFFALAHLFFGGLGMFHLARRWSGSGLGGALAGVVFAFNGLSLNMLMWPSHIATLAWMPWVVFLGEQSWQSAGRKLVWAVLAGALQMLAGGPETIMLTWLFLAAWWGLQLFQRFRAGKDGAAGPRWQAVFWRFPLVVLLVAVLAAAQLLPFLDLVAHSQREQGYADTRWSMPGWGWANFLVPLVFGQVWNMGVFFQYDQAWTSSYYLGIGTILLAPLALARWREGRVWLPAAAAALGFLLSLGDQTIVFQWLRTVLPQLSFVTYPIKYVTLVIFVAPLLMAIALAGLVETDTKQPGLFRRLMAMALVLLVMIGVILAWASRWPFPTDNFSLTRISAISGAVFLVALVAVLRMCERAPQAGWRRGVLSLAALLIFWLDCFNHGPSQNPAVPTWIYQPGLARMKLAMLPQPELGVSRAMLTPFAAHKFISFVSSSPRDNFLVKRLGYFANCNLLDAVPKVDGFFSLYPRESAEVNLLLYGSTNAHCPRLQDFLAVSQVTAPGASVEWTPRASPLPVVTAGQRPLFVDDRTSLGLLAGREWQPAEVVLLPRQSEAEVGVRARSNARIISSRFENHRVEVEAEGAEGFLVVLSQTYYHRWRAYVDGAPAKLLRANYGFQAVALPAGRHRLQVVYEDAALRWGALLSSLGLIFCGAWWWRNGATNGELKACEGKGFE